MTWIIRIALAAVAVMWVAASPVPAVAQGTDLVNRKIEFAYFPPKSSRYQNTLERLKAQQVLEKLSQFLSPLRLPHPFYLATNECGNEHASPFYSPSLWAIVFCYEFVELIARAAPKRGEKGEFTYDEVVIGSFVGIALHEVGHAVFDMLHVPVLGREEDGADQMAAYLALQFNVDVARTVIRGFAYVWSKFGNPKEWAHFADEHGTAGQRFFNTLCLAYGGNPEAFKEFIDKNWLPKKRAANCANEYRQVEQAFIKTVLPFIDPVLMKKVRETEWLPKTTAVLPTRPSPPAEEGPGGAGDVGAPSGRTQERDTPAPGGPTGPGPAPNRPRR